MTTRRALSRTLWATLAALLLTVAACGFAAPAATPSPTARAVRNNAPPPDVATRLIDHAAAFEPDAAAGIRQRIEDAWRYDNLDVLVETEISPGRASLVQTYDDAGRALEREGVGTGARGGIAIYYNLDDSKCHGQAQVYADPRLEVEVAHADRQAVFDELMLPELKACDIRSATLIAIDAVVALANGDRSVLPTAAPSSSP